MTEEQWNAIKTNDRNYDGVFFYALKTTKTICRRSCPARQCNPNRATRAGKPGRGTPRASSHKTKARPRKEPRPGSAMRRAINGAGSLP